MKPTISETREFFSGMRKAGYLLEPWKLHHLKDAYKDDLQACQTEHERIMCRAMYTRDLKKFAWRWFCLRELTPGEISILINEIGSNWRAEITPIGYGQ